MNRAVVMQIGARSAFTLGVLAVYLMGGWIPIPGWNIDRIFQFGVGGQLEPPDFFFTIFALGVEPIVSALAVIETTKIVFPSLAAWQVESSANRLRLERATLALALTFATVTALIRSTVSAGIGPNFEMVSDPGLAFHAGFAVTLVAATVLLAWLADLITRFGIGSGLWVLASAPSIVAVAYLVNLQPEMWMPQGSVALALAFVAFAAGCALLGAVAVTEASAVPSGQLIWPPVLAYMALYWLLRLMHSALPVETYASLTSVVTLGHPLRIAVIAFLIIVIFALRQRTLVARPGLPLMTAAGLVLVSTSGEALLSSSRYPVGLEGVNVFMLVAIVLGLMASLRRERSTIT